MSQWTNIFGGALLSGLGEMSELGRLAQSWEPVFQEGLSHIANFSKNLGSLGNALDKNTYVTLFWSPDGTSWGADLAYGIGNSGTYNYTRSNYHELYP